MRISLSSVTGMMVLGAALVAVEPASALPLAVTTPIPDVSSFVRVNDGVCGYQCQADRWRRHHYGYRVDDGICGAQCQAERRQRYGWRHGRRERPSYGWGAPDNRARCVTQQVRYYDHRQDSWMTRRIRKCR